MNLKGDDSMANKSYGDGSISQRKDGTWTARIFLGKENGKQKIKAIYGKSEKEVRKKMREFKDELIKFDNVNLPKLTVSDIIQDWLEVKRFKVKPSSFDRIERTVNNLILPRIGFAQATSLNANSIQKLLNDLADDGYSYSQIKKVYEALNAPFKVAVIRDQLRKNPCETVVIPKNTFDKEGDVEFYNEEQVKAISEAALEQYANGEYVYKHGRGLIILLNTGMRIGELLALKWDNVDFDKKIIKVMESRGTVIDRNRKEDDKKYISLDLSTKTKAGSRIIPMNKKAEECLRYFKSLNYKSPYVMANGDSKNSVIPYKNLQKALKHILEKTNINYGSLHALRHTFATRLFKRGVEVKVVSELLGHSSVKITYDTYIHVIREQKVEAINILNDL